MNDKEMFLNLDHSRKIFCISGHWYGIICKIIWNTEWSGYVCCLPRLFEMGFQEQLNEIIHRLPESRQTVLFSATLPRLLVEFAKAGLHDPTLIRLDVETKLSEQLKVFHSSFQQF